jgi:hypothetical protein
MRRNHHSWSCLLSFAAVVGMLLTAHGVVFCVRADGTRTFEWRCDAASDVCCDHHQDDHTSTAPRIDSGDCHDIPVAMVLAVNARRESLWRVAAQPLPSPAYLTGRDTTRCVMTPLDVPPRLSIGAGAVRTVVLRI